MINLRSSLSPIRVPKKNSENQGATTVPMTHSIDTEQQILASPMRRKRRLEKRQFEVVCSETEENIKKKKYKKAYKKLERVYLTHQKGQERDFTLYEKLLINQRLWYCINKIARKYFCHSRELQTARGKLLSEGLQQRMNKCARDQYLLLLQFVAAPGEEDACFEGDLTLFAHRPETVSDIQQNTSRATILPQSTNQVSSLIRNNSSVLQNSVIARQNSTNQQQNPVLTQQNSSNSQTVNKTAAQTAQNPSNLFSSSQKNQNIATKTQPLLTAPNLLQSYFVLLVNSHWNFALYYKRDKLNSQSYNLANEHFEHALNITKSLIFQDQQKSAILKLHVKAVIFVAIQKFELGQHSTASQLLQSCLNEATFMLRQLYQDFLEYCDNARHRRRFRKAVKLVIVLLYNLTLNLELDRNFARALETISLVQWLGNVFVPSAQDEFRRCLNLVVSDYETRLRPKILELSEVESLTIQVVQNSSEIQKRLSIYRDRRNYIMKQFSNTNEYDAKFFDLHNSKVLNAAPLVVIRNKQQVERSNRKPPSIIKHAESILIASQQTQQKIPYTTTFPSANFEMEQPEEVERSAEEVKKWQILSPGKSLQEKGTVKSSAPVSEASSSTKFFSLRPPAATLYSTQNKHYIRLLNKSSKSFHTQRNYNNNDMSGELPESGADNIKTSSRRVVKASNTASEISLKKIYLRQSRSQTVEDKDINRSSKEIMKGNKDLTNLSSRHDIQPQKLHLSALQSPTQQYQKRGSKASQQQDKRSSTSQAHSTLKSIANASKNRSSLHAHFKSEHAHIYDSHTTMSQDQYGVSDSVLNTEDSSQQGTLKRQHTSDFQLQPSFTQYNSQTRLRDSMDKRFRDQIYTRLNSSHVSRNYAAVLRRYQHIRGEEDYEKKVFVFERKRLFAKRRENLSDEQQPRAFIFELTADINREGTTLADVQKARQAVTEGSNIQQLKNASGGIEVANKDDLDEQSSPTNATLAMNSPQKQSNQQTSVTVKHRLRQIILRRADIFPLVNVRRIIKELKKAEIKQIQDREADKINQKLKLMQKELRKNSGFLQLVRADGKKDTQQASAASKADADEMTAGVQKQQQQQRPSMRMRIPSVSNFDVQELANLQTEGDDTEAVQQHQQTHTQPDSKNTFMKARQLFHFWIEKYEEEISKGTHWIPQDNMPKAIIENSTSRSRKKLISSDSKNSKNYGRLEFMQKNIKLAQSVSHIRNIIPENAFIAELQYQTQNRMSRIKLSQAIQQKNSRESTPVK